MPWVYFGPCLNTVPVDAMKVQNGFSSLKISNRCIHWYRVLASQRYIPNWIKTTYEGRFKQTYGCWGYKESFTHKKIGITSTLLENPWTLRHIAGKTWWECHLSFPHTPIFWTSGPTSALVQSECPNTKIMTQREVGSPVTQVFFHHFVRLTNTRIKKITQVVTSTITSGKKNLKHPGPKWLPKNHAGRNSSGVFSVVPIIDLSYFRVGVKQNSSSRCLIHMHMHIYRDAPIWYFFRPYILVFEEYKVLQDDSSPPTIWLRYLVWVEAEDDLNHPIEPCTNCLELQ